MRSLTYFPPESTSASNGRRCNSPSRTMGRLGTRVCVSEWRHQYFIQLMGALGCSSSGLQRSLGYGASVLCSFRAEFSTFLPASSPSLFLIPADLKRMATFGGHACLSLPTVLRAIVPEGKGVPCLKFTIPIFNSRIPAVMAAFGLWWLSRCWS